MIGCARLTITTLESGKLKISEKMAEKLALHTGASKSWLLGNNPEVAAVCERDPQRPFTSEVFWMTRVEVDDPRLDPLDVRQIENVVVELYARMIEAAIKAYDSSKVVSFKCMLREFREKLAAHWPGSCEFPPSMDAAEIQTRSKARLEQLRQQKMALKGPPAY